MTNSLAKAVYSFVLIFAMAIPGAWAQDDPGAPVQLPAVSDEKPEDEEDEVDTPSIGTVRVAPRVGSRDMGIEVGVIGGNMRPVGTLSGSDSLGGEIWEGTSATTAQVLLNQVPLETPSRAMSGLLRRLLLSPSQPPRDPRGDDPILALRISKAFDAGFIDAVPSMVDQARALADNEEVQIMSARAILLSGNSVEICGDATARRMESGDAFWMKLRAFCFQQQGLVPAARLTSDLLYDLGDEDELFQVLLDRLSGNERANVTREFGDSFSELHIAMMREAGIAPPSSFVENMSLPMSRSIALSNSWNDINAMRLAAGERTGRASVLSSAELLQVYQNNSPYDPRQRAQLLTAASERNNAASRALFAEAILMDSAPEAKADDMSGALRARGNGDGQMSYAAAVGRAARVLSPDQNLARSAYDFSVAAAADGNLNDAYGWFDVMSADGLPSPAQSQALRAALTIATPSERFAYWPEHSMRWIEQADLGEFSYNRVTTQLILLEALGYAIPDEIKMRMGIHQEALEGELPAPALIENLRAAAQDGRVGETVGTALVVIGPGGPSAAHPLALAEAIRALDQVGLEVDARALATEVLLGFALEEVE